MINVSGCRLLSKRRRFLKLPEKRLHQKLFMIFRPLRHPPHHNAGHQGAGRKSRA
ncbi:hypothetical protein SXCC_03188 [Gluconacetobacter sp. SXCC-1]|nr:hypothetical protein SXCC_03188 [Gluconacetobacter sp. SXCC-1]